jgi:hypothetical protein
LKPLKLATERLEGRGKAGRQSCQQSSGLQALDCNSLMTSSGANPSRYGHILVQSKPKSEDCLRQLAWLDALAPPEILGCEAAVLGGRLVSR